MNSTWKRTAARNVRKLSAEEAKATIARINAEGVTIFHDDIKKLTGGFISQNINFYVIRLLAQRAGIIPNGR